MCHLTCWLNNMLNNQPARKRRYGRHTTSCHMTPCTQAHAPTFTAVYLESALDLGLVSPRAVHSELLLIYLQLAMEEEREGEPR